MGPMLDYIVPAAGDWLIQRQQFQQLLKDNLLQAQHRTKWSTDQYRTERSFAVGDQVLLKLQPHRQTSLSLRKNLKLTSKYHGPYEIVARIGPVAYKPTLRPTSRVHPVFHV